GGERPNAAEPLRLQELLPQRFRLVDGRSQHLLAGHAVVSWSGAGLAIRVAPSVGSPATCSGNPLAGNWYRLYRTSHFIGTTYAASGLVEGPGRLTASPPALSRFTSLGTSPICTALRASPGFANSRTRTAADAAGEPDQRRSILAVVSTAGQ